MSWLLIPSSRRPEQSHSSGVVRRHRYFLTAGIQLLLAMAVIPADCVISKYVLEHPLRGDLRRLVTLGETFGYGMSVGLIIVTAARLDPRGWRVGWRLAVCAFAPGLASNVLKMLVARRRPLIADLSLGVRATFGDWLPIVRSHEPWGYAIQSFPSSHTATAFGLAAGLCALYPRGRPMFLLFATLAGLQRLYSGAHFASDVLVGAALGLAIAGWFATRAGFGLEPTITGS